MCQDIGQVAVAAEPFDKAIERSALVALADRYARHVFNEDQLGAEPLEWESARLAGYAPR